MVIDDCHANKSWMIMGGATRLLRAFLGSYVLHLSSQPSTIPASHLPTTSTNLSTHSFVIGGLSPTRHEWVDTRSSWVLGDSPISVDGHPFAMGGWSSWEEGRTTRHGWVVGHESITGASTHLSWMGGRPPVMSGWPPARLEWPPTQH